MSVLACNGLNESDFVEASERYDRIFSGVVGYYNVLHGYIYHVLCVLGVLANLAIVGVLLRETMRKNPFNLFLIAIAICDMALMASYFIFKQIVMCHPWYFSYTWIVFTYVYAALSVFLHSVSLWLTVNMAVLRYLVLRNSATSAPGMVEYNSYKAAGIAIILAVIVSLFGSAPNMMRYEIRDNGKVPVPRYCLAPSSPYADYYLQHGDMVTAYVLGQPDFWNCAWERISFWLAGIFLKVVPCCLLTIFMALLVRMLCEAKKRKSRLSHGSGMSSSSGFVKKNVSSTTSSGGANAERTTTMLVLIVLVFLITELPQGILVIQVGLEPTFRAVMQHIGDFIDLLSLLNSSVNFILYSTMSNLFRREFLATFRECCLWTRTLQKGKGFLPKRGSSFGTRRPTVPFATTLSNNNSTKHTLLRNTIATKITTETLPEPKEYLGSENGVCDKLLADVGGVQEGDTNV